MGGREEGEGEDEIPAWKPPSGCCLAAWLDTLQSGIKCTVTAHADAYCTGDGGK